VPGLGRLAAPDERDAAYPLRALLPPTPPKVESRTYSTGPVLDQGDTPECVAFAWKQWLDSSPIKDKLANPPAPDWLYHAAQAVDEWAGTPHDGTSVRAGAKVIEGLKRLGTYHWSTSADDVRLYLLTTGTVVFGTDWTNDMFDPDGKGFVKPTGSLAGGHAYLCIGYSHLRGAFRFVNSWSSSWGQKGRFWIAGEDVQILLDRDGEACAALELKAA
jgi:hypothetical protein